MASDFDIRLFPNPVNDRLQIVTGQNLPERIRLVNSLGQVVLNTPFLEMIDVSTYSSGLYFIQLDLENGKRSIDQIMIQE
jgi:hypothetical protein